MIVLAALSRVLPHPPNFAPTYAIALFAGAYVADKRFAFLIPILAMLLSDAILEITTGWGFYSGMWVVYVAFSFITILGFKLREHISGLRVLSYTLAGSTLFFVLTNFAVWFSGSMYPHTVSGLVACYVAALPFFGNTLLSGLFYSALLFGGFAFAERAFPALREEPLVS